MLAAVSMPTKRDRLRWRFTSRRRLEFYTEIQRFTEFGIPPIPAIKEMVDAYSSWKSMRWFVDMMKSVTAACDRGESLAEALQPFVPSEEVALFKTGEDTGNLPEALGKLRFLLEQRLEVNKSLVKNLLPVVIVMVGAFAVMYSMIKTTFAQVQGMLTDEAMRSMTLAPIYMKLAAFVTDYIALLVLGFVGFLWFIGYILPRWKPQGVRKWLDDKAPPFSLYKRLQASFLLTTLSSMLGAGVPFKRAIDDVMRSANPWTRMHLGRVRRALSEGRPETEALMEGILPADIAVRLSVYRLIPSFGPIMEELSKVSIERLLLRVAIIGATLNLLGLLAMAAFILITMAVMGEIGFTVDPRNMQPIVD